MLKFALTDNFFPDFFTEVKIWYCKTLKFVLRRFEVNSSLSTNVFNSWSCK